MWIFTRYGFFSIACARQSDGAVDPGTVMVRARRRAHLEKLAERFEALREIGRRTYVDFEGRERHLLRDEELQFLMIRRGSLDENERREIESHVTHTYRFLEQIPWTPELKGIPEIALGHHEMLNGRGYPRAVSGDAIPVQTRMMTISDIFDALTAGDRPYKRAVPWQRALDILRMEATEGMLDQHLLKSFIDARIFESVLRASA
jgi:hypothetical protein